MRLTPYFLMTAVYLFASCLVLADDLTTVNGRTYTDYVIQRKEPDGLSIRHSSGIVKVFTWELSAEVREKHGLDLETARRYHASRQTAQQSREHDMRRNLDARNIEWGENDARRDAERQKQDMLSRNARNLRVEIVHIDSSGCYARPYRTVTSSSGPRQTGHTYTGAGVARTHTTGRTQTQTQYGTVIYIEGDTANKRIGETWALSAALTGRQQSPTWGIVDKYVQVK